MTTIQNTPKSLFIDKAHYQKFVQSFKESYKADRIKFSPSHFMLYSMFRNKDWRKCFTPCTRPTKLSGGHKPNYAAYQAFWHASKYGVGYFDPFKGTITKEMIAALFNTYLPSTYSFDLGNKISDSPYKVQIEQAICISS
jgi:hypothetical protein